MLRRRGLSLAAAVLSQFWLSGLAAAQEEAPPPAQPPAAEPAPAAPPPAEPAPPAAEPAPPAAAPAEAAPAGGPTREEEIVVTGSRIRRKELATPAPVTVISHDQIMASGRLTIAEYLQWLPEQTNNLNQNANNGGTGQVTVNLRGLDSTYGPRTLVLLNGRRMVAGGGIGFNDYVDVGSIPSSAVDRIEILKDGASAVYGSDAIAGVVNIITKKGWSGTEAVASWGISSRTDGQTMNLGVTTGSMTEKSSALLSASYYKQRSILSSARPWSQYALAYDYYAKEATPGGSGTLPDPKVRLGPYRGVTTGLPAGSILIPLNSQCPTHDIAPNPVDPTAPSRNDCPAQYVYDPLATYAANPAGGFYPWRPTTSADVYNFALENYMVTPQERVGLFGTADAKLGDVARVYVEGSYVNRQQQSALAPEPMWGTVYYGLLFHGASQYNPFDVDIDFRRRLVEADRRNETREFDTFRGVAGIDGTLGDYAGPLKSWVWDVSFNYGRSVGSDLFRGNLNVLKIKDAIGPSFQGTCYANWDGGPKNLASSYSNPISNCVPINLFGPPGSVTPDQLAALTFQGPSKSASQQAITSATFQGELFQIAPEKPAMLLVGAEYRKYEASNIPDPFTVNGYTSGQAAAPISGSYDSKDAFAELVVPILSGIKYAEYLEASAAARTFKYNLFGADTTYKLGLIYRPIQDVRLRGTFSTAFRAPSISELFGGTGLSADPASDPCDDYTHLNADQIARCPPVGALDSGQTQLNAVIGSFGGLKPEKADTFTVGAVYEPRFVKGLSLTVDFWDIQITNPISRDGSQLIVNACILDGIQAACDRITRDADGVFVEAQDLLANQGKDEAQGIDAAARYMFRLPYGQLGLGADSTFLIKRDVTKSASLNSMVVHGRGKYDLGANPTVKANASVQYFLGGANAGVRTRYFGGFKECAGTATGLSYGTDCVHAGDLFHDVPANWTFDGNVGYALASGVGNTSVNVGVTNIFDSKPPTLYSNITQWSDWNYDFLGRRYYVQMVHNF